MSNLITTTVDAGVSMSLVSKTTLTVITNTATSMPINNTQFIHLSFTFDVSSYVSYQSIKLRFLQTSTSTNTIYVYKSNPTRTIESTRYETTFYTEGSNTYREVDVTDEVLSSKGNTIYLAIVSNNTSFISLYTNNHATASYKPKMIIAKVKDDDFIENQKFFKGQTSDNDSYQINIRNGKFEYSYLVYEEQAEFLPLSVSLHYNTLNPTTSLVNGFPIGWRTNFHQTISSSSSNYIYTDGKGRKHTFKLADNLSAYSSTSLVYYETNGNYLTMSIDSTSTTARYKIMNLHNDYMLFDSSGKLTAICKKVTDNKTYQITLTYDTSNRLITIVSPSNVFYIEYGTNQIVLRSVTGKAATLTIDSKSCLVSINNSIFSTSFEYEEYAGSIPRVIDLPSIPSSYYLSKVISAEKALCVDFLSNTGIVDRFKEQTNNNGVYYDDVSYQLIYSRKKTTLKRHPFTNYISSANSTTFEYYFNDEGEIEKEAELINNSSDGLINIYEKTDVGLMEFKEQEEHLSIDTTTRTLGYSVSGHIISLDTLGGWTGKEDDEEVNLTCDIIIKYSLEATRSYNSKTSYSMYVDVYECFEDEIENRIKRIYFDQGSTGIQHLVGVFETKSKYIYLKVINTNSALNININRIVVSQSVQNEKGIYINWAVGTQKIIDGNYYYRGKPNGINYYVGTSMYPVSCDFSINDIKLNKENYYRAVKQGSLKHDVWYNNGRNYLSKVDNYEYFIDANNTIGSFELQAYIGYGTMNLMTYEGIVYDLANGSRTYEKHFVSEAYNNASDYVKEIIDDYGKVTSTIEKNGKITIYSYSNDGNIVEARTSKSGQSLVNIFSYSNNKLESEKTYLESNSIGSKYSYNAKGNIINLYDINDQSNALIRNTYETNLIERISKISFLKSSLTAEHNISYITDANLISGIESEACSYNCEYDIRHNLSKIRINGITYCDIEHTYSNTNNSKTITYASGEKERFTYDKYGNVTKVERKSSNESAFYTYAINTYSTSVTRSDGSSILASNSKIKEQEFGGDVRIRYYYNSIGSLRAFTQTYTSNSTVYVSINPLIKDDESLQDILIANGKLYQINDEDIILQQSKSFVNRITKEIQVCDQEKTYYDVSYIEHLNRAPNKKAVIAELNYKTNYTYSNSIIGTQCSSFVSLQEFVVTDPNDAMLLTKSISYEYNNKGLLSSISQNGFTNSYEYDDYGRLIRENNSFDNKTYVYSYDNVGNIIQKLTYNYATPGSDVGEVTDSITFQYNESGGLNQLISVNGNQITYNSMYQPTSYKSNSLTWSFNKLVSYGNTSFVYEPNGLRTTKTTNSESTRYFYDENGKLIRQILPDGRTLTFIYGNDGIIGFTYKYQNSTIVNEYYYRKNILGDIIEIYYNVNGQPHIACRYVYDAWGNHKVLTSSNVENNSEYFIGNINPFRYRGYYYDVETQLYWVSSRYYSPELCRWISPDSIEYLDPSSINGLNLYAYCNNDPVNKHDPTGHFPWLVLAAFVFVGITRAAANAIGQYQSTGQIDWFEVAVEGVYGGVMGALTVATAGTFSIANLAIRIGVTALAMGLKDGLLMYNDTRDTGKAGMAALQGTLKGGLIGLSSYIFSSSKGITQWSFTLSAASGIGFGYLSGLKDKNQEVQWPWMWEAISY